MTELPDVSPVLDQVFGSGYRADLRRTLLQKADETDDPAYADRLRQAADGRRPLRSLLADPAFQAAVRLDEVDQDEVEARTPTAEQQEDLSRRFARYREEHGTPTFPSAEVLAGYAADARARAERTRDVVAAEELTGWDGSDERVAERRAARGEQDGRGTDRG